MAYQEENLKEKIESTCKGKNTMPAELIELIKFEATQEASLQGLFELHWFDDEVLSRFIIDAKMRERFAVFGKSKPNGNKIIFIKINFDRKKTKDDTSRNYDNYK